MAEELDATLTQPSEAEKRIKQLSDKVKLSETEKDELKKLNEEKDIKIATLERKNTFNSEFANTVANTPQAKDFKDEIEAKVLSGYSLEDATYAVLGKAGKLNQGTVEVESPAGGSATTTVTQSAKKSPKEMTAEERAQAVREAAERGDISWS